MLMALLIEEKFKKKRKRNATYRSKGPYLSKKNSKKKRKETLPIEAKDLTYRRKIQKKKKKKRYLSKQEMLPIET
jgi:hypothetical protein